MEKILVKALMNTSIPKILPDSNLTTLSSLLKEHSLSTLVVTENDSPLGIITKFDMVKVLNAVIGDPSLKTVQAQEIMTSPSITLGIVDKNFSQIALGCRLLLN